MMMMSYVEAGQELLSGSLDTGNDGRDGLSGELSGDVALNDVFLGDEEGRVGASEDQSVEQDLTEMMYTVLVLYLNFFMFCFYFLVDQLKLNSSSLELVFSQFFSMKEYSSG